MTHVRPLLLAAALALAARAAPEVRVVFPPSGATVATEGSTFLIGSVNPPDAPLTVNGAAVTPWRTGGFLARVAVRPGANTVVLRAGAAERRHTFRVPVPAAAPARDTLRPQHPARPLGVYTGETVRLACLAPSGRVVRAAVGERTLALAPRPDNPGLYTRDVAFPQPAERVPVTFFAEGLPDADAGPVTARAAWPAVEVEGPLFEARARPAGDAGDAFTFLVPGFRAQGAGFDGDRTRLWLGGRLCLAEARHLKTLPAAAVLPPRQARPADLAAGFGPHPPAGRKPGELLIVLDPGHGGGAPGAVGPTGVTEKEAALAQAKLAKNVLERAGFRVRLTRDRDRDVGLYERARLAYELKAAAFISLHYNSCAPSGDPRASRHLATYAWNEDGLRLGRALHPRLVAASGIPDGGVRGASLAVCRNPAVPAVLVELDFITCPEGEEAIRLPERQRRVAEALLAGLRDWLAAAAAPPPA